MIKNKALIHGNKNIKKYSGMIYYLAYIAGIFGVIVYIPQLLIVWGDKNVSGLSLLSWCGFFIGSVIWFLYGLIQKQKPMIITNILLAIIQFIIVLGILLFR